jgi:hypothetical protein
MVEAVFRIVAFRPQWDKYLPLPVSGIILSCNCRDTSTKTDSTDTYFGKSLIPVNIKSRITDVCLYCFLHLL